MQKIADLTLSDNIGEEYTFEVYRRFSEFDIVAGVYAFTRRTANQHGARHTILYIGKTSSFKRRLNYNHEKWVSATRKGMTHICVYPTNNRCEIEKRLILKYNPTLNYRVG